MLVALYLTTLPAPRLYGVDVTRVIDQDTLRLEAIKADVIITDTPFDTSTISVKRCCVLRTRDTENFALENGFDCIEITEVPKWFGSILKIDVTRRARSGAVTTGSTTSPVETKTTGNAKYKAMYDGLVAELRKSNTYKNLDPNDAKTYDTMLQTMRGSLRKADNTAEDIKNIQIKLVKVEADAERLKAERGILDEDIKVILSGLMQAVNECAAVLTFVSGLSQDTDLVEYSCVAVKARAAFGLSQKFSSVIEAKELRAIGSVAREFLSCVAAITTELAETGVKAVKVSANAQNTSHLASMAKSNAERAVNQANAMLEQEQANVVNLTKQLAELNTKYSQQIQRAAEAENQLLLSGGTSIPALQEQVRTLRAELQAKNETIIRMEEINNVQDDGNTSTDVLPPEVATGIIRQLRTQVASLKLERDRATSELMKAKQAAVRESERAETLTNSARSLSQVALRGAQVSALPLFNYAAKALIIPVFGNGSTGISSAAVSLAKMLGVNSRTIIVDYDLVSTDLEGRFGERINPLVSIDGASSNSGKNSAMGLFIDKGKDFFASHFSELNVRIDSSKAGILDYLPGFYAKPDLFMLTQADYTAFLNYLGARYDYIVIDAGKIGCSEIGDQILRNFCLCSFRSLIITDTSVEKTRAMRLKLNDVFGTAELRKVIERSVWMTNRAVDRMDLSRFTAPAASVTVPALTEMVGAHESFHITHTAQREFTKVVRALAGV